MIIGLSGMKSLQVMLDAPEMAVISKVSQTTVQCILDPLSTVDDSLFTFIPVDVSTDHDDEMEVEAASLDEVKQWGDTSDTPMAWTMPQIGQDTSQYFQSAMSDLCNEFRSIFTEFSILDDVSGKEHFEIIVKPGAIPQWVTLGRLPHYQREIIEEFITLFIKLGIIEPANSPWGARPIIIKKGTSHRLCVNFAPLNAVTQRDNWPVPLVEDIIDKLINSKLFYTCDLRRAFMQFPIKEEHRFYTAFVSHLGTFQFKRVPFGVMNGPAFLARQVDRVLRSATDVQKFFDDIVAGTPHGEEELLISIRQLFNLLFDAKLRLNPEKSFFGVREVKVLGCIVSEKGRRIDPAKLEGVLSIKSCTNATAVRQFTGICNYFSTYIKDYADISEPLVRLMRKDVDFEWTKLCEDSFQLLKILLTQAPVLAIPDPKRPFHVHTDASAYALGAVLLQEDLTLPGQLKPIWYASRILLSAEKNYTTTEQEGLAVVWARKKFRYYLEGNQWTCATDHMALINILGTKSTSCRIQRWTLCLSGEDLKVYHVKGESNVIADALSRLPLQLPNSIPIPIAQLITDNSGQEPISIGELRARADAKKRLAMSSNPALFVMSTPHFSDPAVWKQAQSVDNWCAFIIEQLKFNPVSKFSMKHGYLLHSHDNVVFCLTVPNAFVKSVIHFNHTAPLAGHLATRKTIARISAQFFWPKLSSDVTNFIDNCILCVMEKGNRFIKSPLPDGSITVQANHFNDIVAWDIQGPFHLTSNNNKNILVISDLFSRFAVSIAIPDMTAITVASMFIMHWIAYFGPPNNLLSDNGTQFKSEIMRDVAAIMDTRLKFTPPYHPQGNGNVERLNRTFTTMVKKYVNEAQTDWDIYLPTITYAYNSSEHETTKATPFEVVFGKTPPTLIDRFHATEGLVKDRSVWGEAIRSAHDKLILSLRQAQDEKAKTILQKNIESNFFSPFSVGDYVFLENKGTLGDGKRHKHDVNLLGPYKIISFKSQSVFILSNVKNLNEREAHYSLLSPVSASLALQLKQQEEGGETIPPNEPNSLPESPSTTNATISQQSTKRRRKHKKITQNSSDATITAAPTAPVVSSSRKVRFVPSPPTTDVPGVPPTRSGRVVSKPARFLITIVNGQDLSFQQVGEGKNVTPN